MTMTKYEELGVRSDKSGIARLFALVTRNDFPGAFCKIVRMPEFPGHVITKHSDGVGSLSLTRLLVARELGDPTVLQGDADNALIMNVGDIVSCGFFRNTIYVTDNIDINLKEEKTYLAEFANRMIELVKLYHAHGIELCFKGGETANLPDQVSSVVMNMDVCSIMKEEQVISGNTQNGDIIWGFSSAGKAAWEKEENSGVMSNGATGLRNLLLRPNYYYHHSDICPRKFMGNHFFEDIVPGTSMNLAQALTSPTRHFSFLMKRVCELVEARGSLHMIHGMGMNTGGGLTKIGKLGKNISYEMAVPPPPPIFQLVHGETKESWKKMYRTYNNGVGMFIVGSDESGIVEQAVKQTAAESGVEWFRPGECKRYDKVGQNQVVLRSHQNGNSYTYPVKLDH